MRRIFALVVAGALIAATQVAGAGVEGKGFPQGVASGEMSPTSAVLWTRARHVPTQLQAQVSTRRTFATYVSKTDVDATDATDGTVHQQVTGLQPAHTYFYRFRDNSTGTYSRVGTFMTPPDPGVNVDVHFAWSGDADGWTNPDGSPGYNKFQSLDAARASGAQFFMYLGDTIYSDSKFSKFTPPGAVTVGQYRRTYRQNLRTLALRNLMASMGVYANWDDHEVRNDFDRATVDPTLFENGKQVFQEYMAGATWDPQVGFYRTFRWGKGVQFFVLDQRSFRDPEVAHFPVHPGETSVCDNPPGSGVPDIAPSLPASVRVQFSLFVQQLGMSVPPACTAALNDPSRSLLGAAQLAQFEQDLSASTATFKVVFTGDPIQNEYVVPYDRWEGYLFERNQMLNFITSHDIGGVVWLATDQHDNLTNSVWTDRLTAAGTDTGMSEAIVGPIATDTFADEIARIFGDPGVSKVFESFAKSVLGASCANVDTYAWGDVHYNAKAKTLTVQQKDAKGKAVCPPLVVHP
jgi:phosphodiesterase/alkaline phosphatase D-like protein